ncbi:hypothetical protein CRUP_021223 [Coryphaenoides rupestris]|nr:hypothetical protein CRUP_021223 [Coryphaenoides rupestris]
MFWTPRAEEAGAASLTNSFLRSYLRLNMASGSGWTPQTPQTPCTPPVLNTSSKHLRSCTSAAVWSLEYTQDLHLKMSKKISQLTKVIYALNTKNDEHEEEMESLKEAHEDEVQHIVTETRDRIMQFRNKMADEVDLRRRLASLEESVEMHEHMKRQALAEFDMYRQRIEDDQLCTEAQHTQRVVSMSREVEEMRRDFEEKLRAFGQAQAQVECEKRRALEELRASHRHKVEELLNAQQNQSASSSEDQEKLAELHRQEVESLMERVAELTMDKVHLVEEYEAKLAKAQDFYERELEAMRRTHQLTAENLLAWKRTEVELRKEFQAQEVALQRSLSKLRGELQRAQEDGRENRDKTNRLQTSLTNAEGTIKNLHQQLAEAQQDGDIWVMQLKDTEDELENSRDRVQQQASELLHKASQIGSLQATQMSHETTIRDLDQEQARLKDQISRLEGERVTMVQAWGLRDGLVSSQSLREEHQRYEKELCRLRARYEEEALRFKEAQVRSLEEMEERQRALREEVRQEKEEEKELLITISCLKDTQDKLKVELDATRARVRETSNLLTDMQEEVEMESQQHEARLLSIRTEEKQRMDKMADDLDQKEELHLLREVLSEEYEADKQAAVTQLSQQKDLEILSARESWQRKVEDLLEQVSLLKQSLELQLSQSQSALQQLQSQFSQERELLSQQLKDLQRDHQRREHRLQEAHCCALSTMEEARQHQILALEERLKQEQREEVQALKEAHRRTLEVLRQQSEQELETLRYELEDEGKAMLGEEEEEETLRYELEDEGKAMLGEEEETL